MTINIHRQQDIRIKDMFRDEEGDTANPRNEMMENPELQIEENLFAIWINYNGQNRNQEIKQYLEDIPSYGISNIPDFEYTSLNIDTFLGEDLQNSDEEQLFDHIIHAKYNTVNPITDTETLKENLEQFIETNLNIRNFIVSLE